MGLIFFCSFVFLFHSCSANTDQSLGQKQLFQVWIMFVVAEGGKVGNLINGHRNDRKNFSQASGYFA